MGSAGTTGAGARRAGALDTMKERSAPELPVLHRLAIVYLMLPVVVWLVGWFEWWLGIPVAALLVCALRRPLSGSWRPRAPSAAEVAALAVAAGMVMMTAAGGVFDVGRTDWIEHRATLLDLGRYPWPTYLPDPLAVWRPAPVGEAPAPPLLRYYLGWHMAPGLVAHWFGPAALSWAVPLWTWAGVALVTLLFTRGCRGRAVAVALLVLFVFSGMDLVRVSAFKGWEWVDSLTEGRGWQALLYHEVGTRQAGFQDARPDVGASALPACRAVCPALPAASPAAPVPGRARRLAGGGSVLVGVRGRGPAAAPGGGWCGRTGCARSCAGPTCAWRGRCSVWWCST